MSVSNKSILLFMSIGLIFQSTAFAASQCGETWVFTQGKYDKYYGEIWQKYKAYQKECEKHGSMTDARFSCDRKVHEWYNKNKANIDAKYEADGRAHDARRDQCLGREKANYERQQAYNRHAEQAQRNAERQAEQRRQQFNAELERSNAEREAYNRAAQERAEQQQRDYQRQAEAAQKAAELRAEQQRQAEIAAAQARKELFAEDAANASEYKKQAEQTRQEKEKLEQNSRQEVAALSRENASFDAAIEAARRKKEKERVAANLAAQNTFSLKEEGQLSFQEIRILEKPGTPDPERDEYKNPAASETKQAGIQLLHSASKALNGWAVEYKVNQEIDSMKPLIISRMPENGGLLLCVQIQAWATPDPAGATAESYLSTHIAGTGSSAEQVLTSYRNQAQYEQGSSKGWKRKQIFVWVTKNKNP